MITFFVAGIPIPKGSAKGFVVKSKLTGKHRAIITQTNKAKQDPWASIISFTARQHFGDRPLITGPVCIGLTFIMPRPKKHFGTGKKETVLRDDAPTWHTGTPDLDKLIRGVLDPLTSVVWEDDSQVALMAPPPSKQYGDKRGVYITIKEL